LALRTLRRFFDITRKPSVHRPAALAISG
jgi:hypothetical protein